MIKEVLDGGGAHAPLFEQIEDDTGIERAAAGSHWQAVERREAHGRVNAAATAQGTKTGAIAEMRDYDPAKGDLRSDCREPAGDELI